MKTQCQSCGIKFTRNEINQLQDEIEEFGETEFICNECTEERNSYELSEQIDEFSDADPGL